MKKRQINVLFFILSILVTNAFCLEETDEDGHPTLESNIVRPNAEGLLCTSGFEEGCFQFIIGGRPTDTEGPLWAQAQFQGDYSGSFASEPVRAGSKALRLEWRAAGVREDNTSKKAMIHFGKAATPAETDHWYGFSLYLPSADFPVEEYNVLLFQVHATPDFRLKEPHRKPPVSLSIRDGVLNCWHSFDSVRVSPKNKNIDLNGSLEPICQQTSLWDRWTDFVVHARFSLEGKGVLEVWKDGRKVVSLHDIMLGYNDEIGGYPSWGIYSYNGHSHRILFLDEVRVGDRNAFYEQVAPGKLDGTQIPESKEPVSID